MTSAAAAAATEPLSPSAVPSLFSDLEPTPQVEASPVCSINYSAGFVLAYDYLRTVLRTDERSVRTLRLTGLCLKLNPANYTVWHYRRRILGAMKRNAGDDGDKANEEEEETLPPLDDDVIKSEMTMASEMGGANPKNYQIWYHRRALLEPIFESAGKENGQISKEYAVAISKEELEYISTVLDNDGKNYHAWSHRQWILRSVNFDELWQSELSYTDMLIERDIRNNSAWNHRWFVCHRGLKVPTSPDDAISECTYALSKAELDPYNESPWSYLLGSVKEQIRSKAEGSADLLDRTIDEAVKARRAHVEEDGPCPNADSARVDLWELRGGTDDRAEAAVLAHKLGTEDDVIRRKYWARREERLRGAKETE